ncbi:hypothetical protein IFM89_014948 [Coptis chinensis]|uniref:Pentatricopeptide repeat-containing protein n=1 Tax=Coptis chinensis TaxID=261450 RepID=A0A835H6F8_9MAGN|nr:hypothetical protein IFM89_014948 [Coptis chinensis]
MVAEADKLVDEMLSKSVQADVTTYTILFDAYFKQERIRNVLKWFLHLVLKTALEPSFALVNSVCSGLINKGVIEEAGEILERMTVTQRGGHQKPFLFANSYELLLTESCKQGKIDLVWDLPCVMVRYNIGATPKLHGIVPEAFGKEDRVDQIESKLQQLTVQRYGGVVR